MAFSATQDPRKRKHGLISAIQHPIKRDRKQKRVGDALSVENNIGIDILPDEILVAILSLLSLKEAGRTSVLSRRWRYLWRFTSGSLDFDCIDNVTRTRMKRKKFKSWVNHVLELHQGAQLDCFEICYTYSRARTSEIDRWIYFAMRKEVKRFELSMGLNHDVRPYYKFPDMEKLLSVKSAFGSLRSLRLDCVNVEDEVVHYILSSCVCLEMLRIESSDSTRNLRVVDPIPNLKFLEIWFCDKIQSVEISTASLVSFKYRGREGVKLLFKKVPNLSELTLAGGSSLSFIYEPGKHSSYSVQLVKLELRLPARIVERAIPLDLPQFYSLSRLELATVSQVGRSLLFFTSLIKASPLLREFIIAIDYRLDPDARYCRNLPVPFPEVSAAEAPTFCHNNLKLVEILWYIGCSSEEKFLLQLFKVAPMLEKVIINTRGYHFEKEPVKYHKSLRETGARTRPEAKERARRMEPNFPPETQLIVL